MFRYELAESLKTGLSVFEIGAIELAQNTRCGAGALQQRDFGRLLQSCAEMIDDASISREAGGEDSKALQSQLAGALDAFLQYSNSIWALEQIPHVLAKVWQVFGVDALARAREAAEKSFGEYLQLLPQGPGDNLGLMRSALKMSFYDMNWQGEAGPLPWLETIRGPEWLQGKVVEGLRPLEGGAIWQAQIKRREASHQQLWDMRGLVLRALLNVEDAFNVKAEDFCNLSPLAKKLDETMRHVAVFRFLGCHEVTMEGARKFIIEERLADRDNWCLETNREFNELRKQAGLCAIDLDELSGCGSKERVASRGEEAGESGEE